MIDSRITTHGLTAVYFAAMICLGTYSAAEEAKEQPWQSLFDGKTLKGWEVCDYAGAGDVEVKDGTIHIDMGEELSGLCTEQKIPTTNYEVYLEAQRVEGQDFFVGLTFPVKKDNCSLILGGWGGSVVGLSSLDGFDASENDTTTYETFENGHWYKIHLAVTDERIRATVDGKVLVDEDITDHNIGIRIEMYLCKPFGFAAWQTESAIRKVQIRPLSAAALKKINTTDKE
ncbi:3-keto-disaccharide hydrolase [Calycomorphotria hydatis]|uniref:3-keto-alpha-glucoside-1,2-lyase/3-keto-2-hydroxy-glucal hydratase domain-containing protein n=1 Tax=Calycomorphotria hydatis TaxID=2528027 RepID=A0A517T3L6_9PLAN|nr:DUF1080 domain-containing protein [Calycomorphotria hydatis]QDT62964.1 hypothetical protein V22_01620 [Calycomorphotria hydatis]